MTDVAVTADQALDAEDRAEPRTFYAQAEDLALFKEGSEGPLFVACGGKPGEGWIALGARPGAEPVAVGEIRAIAERLESACAWLRRAGIDVLPFADLSVALRAIDDAALALTLRSPMVRRAAAAEPDKTLRELASIQKLAMAAEAGEVDAHQACGEIAQRLGYYAVASVDPKAIILDLVEWLESCPIGEAPKASVRRAREFLSAPNASIAAGAEAAERPTDEQLDEFLAEADASLSTEQRRCVYEAMRTLVAKARPSGKESV